MVTIPYIVSRVGSKLVWCHMAVCSLYIALYPYVTGGSDEHYYERTLCWPPALSVRTMTFACNPIQTWGNCSGEAMEFDPDTLRSYTVEALKTLCTERHIAVLWEEEGRTDRGP